MIYTERQTGRKYQLVKVASEAGRCMDRVTLIRYDIIKRYI